MKCLNKIELFKTVLVNSCKKTLAFFVIIIIMD